MDRKEAIEIVRKNYPHVGFSGSEFEIALRELVPELKESEDERIRKHIIKILDGLAPCHWDGNEKADCIAYLERQKEQKYYTYEQSKQAAEDCYYDKGYNTEDDGRCNEQSFLWGFEEGVDWCEQQKEQKPAEWSEEDELFLGVCKNAISKYGRSDKWDAGIISEWLENRLKSLRPQPHWRPSEEQMRAVFDASERNDGLGSVLRDFYNDLKRNFNL